MDYLDFIIKTDSYKVGHHPMYHPDNEIVYSYLESREGARVDSTVFFGLQAILKKHFVGPVFNAGDILRREKFFERHFNGQNVFNKQGWTDLLEAYGGRIPISVKAVAEGSEIPINNIMMSVENTDTDFPWITNYCETMLSHVWYMSAIATMDLWAKRLYKEFIEATGSTSVGMAFMLHDFGLRGVSSLESGCLGGMAHLVNFSGTDTLPALDYIEKYYPGMDDDFYGYSVNASEHSIMTSFTEEEDDLEAVEHLLDIYPTGILSVVADSYDIFRFCERLGTIFKDRILGRNGVFVVRSDSGEQIAVLLKMLGIFEYYFDIGKTDKGFKVLPPQLRILISEDVTYSFMYEILRIMMAAGWAAENFVFGMGQGLLQDPTRSLQNIAFKASAIRRKFENPETGETESRWIDVYKNPVTDNKKSSKKGRLGLVRHPDSEEYATFPINALPYEDQLIEVFRNGSLLVDQSFREVRERIRL